MKNAKKYPDDGCYVRMNSKRLDLAKTIKNKIRVKSSTMALIVQQKEVRGVFLQVFDML